MMKKRMITLLLALCLALSLGGAAAFAAVDPVPEREIGKVEGFSVDYTEPRADQNQMSFATPFTDWSNVNYLAVEVNQPTSAGWPFVLHLFQNWDTPSFFPGTAPENVVEVVDESWASLGNVNLGYGAVWTVPEKLQYLILTREQLGLNALAATDNITMAMFAFDCQNNPGCALDVGRIKAFTEKPASMADFEAGQTVLDTDGLTDAEFAEKFTLDDNFNMIFKRSVLPEEPDPAIEISLDRTAAELNAGDTLTLIATVTPEGSGETVNWTSSAESVATVSSEGVVRAVSAGTTTITAACGGKTAACEITVSAAPVALEDADSYADGLRVVSSKKLQTAGAEYGVRFVRDWDAAALAWLAVEVANPSDVELPLLLSIQNLDGTVTFGFSGEVRYLYHDGVMKSGTVAGTSVMIPANFSGTVFVPKSGILNSENLDWSAIVSVYCKIDGFNYENWSLDFVKIGLTEAADADSLATAEAAVWIDFSTEADDGAVKLCEYVGEATADDIGFLRAVEAITPPPTEQEPTVTGISLDRSTASMTVGSSLTLIAAVTPADSGEAMSWTSSAEDVATVSSEGVVRAVSTGTATITVTCGGKTAVCTVTVTAADKGDDGDKGEPEGCGGCSSGAAASLLLLAAGAVAAKKLF